MSNFNQKIENLKRNGYSLDLGEIISQSIENFKKIAVNAGLATLLVSIALIAISFGTIGVIVGFANFGSEMAGFHVTNFSTVNLIFYIIGTALVGGIMYPFTAGIIKMAHEAETGREINLSMAFDHYKSDSFKNLFITGLLLGLTTNAIATVFQFMHLDFLGALITYVVSFFAIFAIPLVIFEKLNPTDAILNSFALVIKQPFVILITLLIAVIIALVGIIALCIGIFFTLPIIYSTQYILYKNAVGVEEKNEIDEIGTTLDM